MSNKFENKDFWNQADVIKSQDREINPKLYSYEKILLDKLPLRLTDKLRIQIIGCGTGRETFEIYHKFPNSQIVASDISEKMIEKFNQNLHFWKLDTNRLILKCCSAENLDEPSNSSDLVTVFTSTLTYVFPSEMRNNFLKNLYRILKPGGFIIGVVHHRYGRLTKSMYFILQYLYAWIFKITPGDRIGGFYNKKLKTHYFTKQEIKDLLIINNFEPILVSDLYNLFKMEGKKYNRWKGDNNIVFIAKKR
ncbi:MAG: class I SAM-dependent methyltransferase [Thermoplasmata archaeon]